MRKHTLTRIISYLVLLCIMLCLVCIYGFKTNASDFKDDYSERKISSNVDLNSEFDTKSVIVVLKPSQSQYRGINTNVIRKLYSIDGVESLEELANVSDDLLVDDKTLKSIDSEIIRHLKEIDYKQIIKIVLNTNTKEKVIDVVHKIELFDEVLYAGPNYYYKPTVVSPDDTRYSEQWALHGTNGIDANEAWDVTTGSGNIRVGIIDSGIALHEDLNANLVSGYDYYHDNTTTTDVDGSHGTKVAGIIGAVGDNETGVAGVNHHVSLVPMQVSYISGGVWFSGNAIIDAIDAATSLWDESNRISILNYSGSGFGNSPSILAAIERFPGLFVWSAGNAGVNVDDYSDIEDYALNNLISVGAHDINGNRSIWNSSQSSCYGEAVNIYAPGGGLSPLSDNCLTTTSTSFTAYDYFNGTSCAAPHVSGVAALLLSINNNLSANQLKTAILASAETISIQIPSGDSTTSQNVLKLNAYNAVRYVLDNYTININCATTMHSLMSNCPENGSIVYKVNIKCPKSYKFISSALSPLDMTFYDSSFNEITSITPVMTNSNCTGTITTYLNPGTYYLRVNFVSGSSSGNITTSYQATWPVSLNATFNTNLNILSNLHLTGNNDYHCVVNFNNTYGEKLFKFKLDAGNNATYPEGAIKVYTDSTLTNPLDRYSVNGITYPATSNALENELYVFLPEKGTYYIEITLPRNDYASLQFLVSDVDEMSINYLNTLATSTLTNIFSYKTEASYFKKVDISHKSKIKIELNSNTGCFNSTKLFIFKLNKDPGYDIGVNHYSLSSILQVNLTYDEDSYNTTLILDEGTYYIGYTNNINCSLNLNLRRLINTNVNMDGTLVADPMPNQGYTIGSEVLLNNGSYNNYNITEGFTRCIYLMVDNILLEPNSRLAYDWYSSDDSVAMVTQYGTVLAKSVTSNTNVTIYAILKEDPSVVYRKTFTILNDTLTYSNAPINIYTSMTVGAGVYTPIDLSDEVVPINILQYYSWSISQGGSVDYWGNIYANTTSLGDTLYITGNYIYNSRVKIFIDAFVTLPMSGYELDYNPLLWDDDVEDYNNCYNYAINSQVKPGTNDLWNKQQPGQYSESMTYDYSDYDAMYTAVHKDFVKYNQTYNTNLIFMPIDKFAKCPEGTYKVALVACSDDWDYHWYRQDSDGYWSHKPGTDFVRRYDDSYDLIIDPSNCDWGVYDTFLGFFAVSPWNTMYTEPENMRTLGETNPSISLIDLDDIGDLEIGMSYYEVIQTLGSTGLDIGSGTIIQQYETTSGNIVLINYHLVNGEYVVVSIDIE